MIKWPNTMEWFNMVIDIDIGSMIIAVAFALTTTLAFFYSSRPLGTVAIVSFFMYAPYRALFIMKIKPFMIYKQWRTQILCRRNDKGIELSLQFYAFKEHFPNGTEDQYNRVMTLLLAHREELGLLVDSLGVPYYIGN